MGTDELNGQRAGDSFVAVVNRVTRICNPDLARPDDDLPASLHHYMLGLHQRWLERTQGDGWGDQYGHDVWTLHLREIPILDLKRYHYSRGRRNFRGLFKVDMAGRMDGQHGTVWSTVQHVPSLTGTRTIEVVVGAEWSAGEFTGGRAFCRGEWADQHLGVLRPLLELLDGVPGFEAAVRTAALLDRTADEELFEGDRMDEEALEIIARARQAASSGQWAVGGGQ